MMVNKKIDASSIELWRYYRRQPYLFAQLPEMWRASIETNYAEAMKRVRLRQRRRAIPVSIMATFAALAVTKAKSAPTTYTTTLTGHSADTQYSMSTDASGNLVYAFTNGDSITTTGTAANVYAVDLENSAPKVVLQAGPNGSGQLSFSTVRPAVGSWGEVDTINVQNGANLTVNGNSTIYAQTADVWNSKAIGLLISNATATFNGRTSVSTYTTGYSQAVSINHSFATFNGDVSFTAQARGSMTSALYISGGGFGNVVINGNATVVGFGIWPSDNVHGIYNDNVNTRLTINGNLTLSATSNGSTVMGIRNQGNLRITGNASITANGPRSAYGIDNTHRTARTYVGGDLSVAVTNTTGYTPFGNPTGLSNLYGMGGSMTFGGAASVDVSAVTEAYAINNTGVVSFTAADRSAVLRTRVNCSTCDAYGIRNSGGSVSFAGGLDVSESNTGSGRRYAVYNVATSGNNALVTVNQAGGQSVKVDGDVLTGNVTDTSGLVYSGTTTLNFDDSASYLKGLVLGYTQTGTAKLSFAHGAAWIPTGAGTLSTDFGAGSLALGSGSAIDMASYWGAFAVGHVPSYSLRALQVDSSSGGASMSFSDGAVFTLLSDIRNGQADKVVFGSGITSFTAQGAQAVRIAYDPVLDSTSWVNAAALQNGVTIAASHPIVVVDAGAAAQGTARFQAVKGLASEWSATYENALVRFSYLPVVSVSPDGKQILLTGIDVLGNDSTATAGGTSSSTNSSSGIGAQSGNAGAGGSSSGASSNSSGTGLATAHSGAAVTSGTFAMSPSTNVLVAGDAMLALANMWKIEEQAVSRRSEAWRADDASIRSGIWADTEGEDVIGNGSGERSYRQSQTSTSVGAERQTEFDGGRNIAGLVYTHTQSSASLQNGHASLSGDSIGAYGTWTSNHGVFADVVARVGRLRASYSSTDAFGTASGRYHTSAASASVRVGRHFEGAHGGYIEPQLQTAYGSIGANSYVASNQVRFDVKQQHTFMTRAGVLLGKRFYMAPDAIGDVYARVSWVHTAGGRPNVTASFDGGAVPVDLPTREGMANEEAVGGHVALGRAWSVFAEGGRLSRDGALAGGWHAAAGVRVAF